jgi:hypothetical protein
MKNKSLSKKQRIALIDAWAALNSLCCYLENKDGYTEKYNPLEVATGIYKKVDSIVSVLYEDDL